MLKNIFSKVAGNVYDREIAEFTKIVEQVAALESQFQALSDEDLLALTEQFRARLADGETLDDILPEAFAAVREAAVRTIGLRHYDVQIIGGIVLHRGTIAEMKTGEGKTLVATLPLYLNALSGKGAHLVTVNDYLARRDGGWMGKIYHKLGVTVGVIGKEQFSALYDPDYVEPGGDLEDERLVHWRPAARQEAYQADVTYGTSSEFGFDYLRDNISTELSRTVQRELNYVVVDEVDSVLIDGARTPLIISGPADPPAAEYGIFAKIIKPLRRNTSDLEFEEPNGDYEFEDRSRSISLTERGIARVEQELHKLGIINMEEGEGESVYDAQHYHLVHYLDNALRATHVYKRDVDYIVHDGRVILIDQTTGRPMPSRRYSEGLHQSIEAKEGVDIRREDMTVATITVQNYFRLYDKLAGMTGTALTQAEEFDEVYELQVAAIPTNVEYMALQGELDSRSEKNEGVEMVWYTQPDNAEQPAYFRRTDYPDVVYKDEDAKFDAVIEEIVYMHQANRPTLVGTASVEASEKLSNKLNKKKVDHHVLNARFHDKEALIVSQAGLPGAVVISTSMAGRGTDILLGGNPEGLAAQHVEKSLFTEEHLHLLAERFVEGGLEAALRLANAEAKVDPALAEWMAEADAQYQAIVEAVESKGLRHTIAQELSQAWNASFDHMVDVVRYVSEGDTERARQMVQAEGLPPETLVDARRRYEDYSNAQAAYAAQANRARFLSNRLFERHYNARASLTRAVLAGEIAEAQALVETIPALPATLITDVQNIVKQCRANRQQIWQAGGLHVIGTERHEARRIDNQLRGRAARQGDPGSSRFFLSLEDELMRRFGGERIKGFMEWTGVPDDEPITAGMLSKAIETAQNRFEGYHFDIRKNLIEYDEAVNQQRGLVYKERRGILQAGADELDASLRRFFSDEFERLMDLYLTPEQYLAFVETQLEEALIEYSDLETDEVNARAVMQSIRSFLPDLTPGDVLELDQLDSQALGNELSSLVEFGLQERQNVRLLTGAIVRIMPLWPALPDVSQGVTREQQTLVEQNMRAQFDMYARSLPEDERKQHWQAIAEGISKAYRLLANERAAKGDNQQLQAAAFNQAINRVLMDASVDLLAVADPDDLHEALVSQVDRLISLWRDHPAIGIGADDMLEFQRAMVLSAIDGEWRQYLTAIDDLRQGIGLEAYGQRDPKVEYKRRVAAMFEVLGDSVREGVVTRFFRELPRYRDTLAARRRTENLRDNLSQTGYRAQRQSTGGVTIRKEMWDVGRNDLCPCGSGKKFKNCHYHQVRKQQQTVAPEAVKQTRSSKRGRRR